MKSFVERRQLRTMRIGVLGAVAMLVVSLAGVDVAGAHGTTYIKPTGISAVAAWALVITGDHFLRTPHRTIAATTSLLWQSDDREYRLESDRDDAELIELARQIAAGS